MILVYVFLAGFFVGMTVMAIMASGEREDLERRLVASAELSEMRRRQLGRLITPAERQLVQHRDLNRDEVARAFRPRPMRAADAAPDEEAHD
jgi:hypothetical protein